MIRLSHQINLRSPVLKLTFLYVFLSYSYTLTPSWHYIFVGSIFLLFVYKHSNLCIPPLKTLIPFSFLLMFPICYSLLTNNVSHELVPQFFYFISGMLIVFNSSLGVTPNKIFYTVGFSIALLSLFSISNLSSIYGLTEYMVLAIFALVPSTGVKIILLFIYAYIHLFLNIDFPKTVFVSVIMFFLSERFAVFSRPFFLIMYFVILLFIPLLSLSSLYFFPELEATTHLLSGRPFIWDFWISFIHEHSLYLGVGSYHSEYYKSILSMNNDLNFSISQPHSIFLSIFLFNGGIFGLFLFALIFFLNLKTLSSNGMIPLFYFSLLNLSFSTTGPIGSLHPMLVLFWISIFATSYFSLKPIAFQDILYYVRYRWLSWFN